MPTTTGNYRRKSKTGEIGRIEGNNHMVKTEFLHNYVQPWGLSEFTEMGYSTANTLYKCESKEHGACMLKICFDTGEAKNQFNTLREYNGNRFCKVYNADIENGVLLLERIDYAKILRCIDNLDGRLNIFCELFRGLHIKPADKSLYPTYFDWVSRITEYMRSRDDYKDLCGKMIFAEEICRSLCEKYTGEMLLHGDLHHDNILIDKNGQYRIIDPKGVIGDRVFDIPRFILNEFDDTITDESHKKITHIIETLSIILEVDESDIRRLLYVETCMAHCWLVEDGETPDMNVILLVENLLQEGY
jgi:streptomycin 6-kinase